MQRIRVGLIGLVSVSVVVLLASALYSSAHQEQPVAVAGAPNANVVADISQGNSSDDKSAAPLAELGVEPGTTDTPPGNQSNSVAAN